MKTTFPLRIVYPRKDLAKAITAVPIYQRLQSLHDLRTEEFVI